MELPTIDSLMEAKSESANTQGTASPEPQVKQEESSDRIEREQKHRREIYKAQQRIKELEAKTRDTSDKTSGIDLNSKNPFKDVVKAKGMSQDEIVRLALEAMDDGLSPSEKKSEFNNMSPQEIAELVKKQLKEEQTKEQEENGKKDAETKALTDFKGKIKEKATELAGQYPLVDGLGGHDAAYNLIEQQFTEDAKQYGEDYASENMMKIEDAVKKVNETLAINVKEALKSKHLKEFLLKAIKEESGEAKDLSKEDNQSHEKDITLNNRDFRAGTEPASKPQFKSNQEELDFLISKFI